MSKEMPVYYCLQCGYVGSMPGICPECRGEMVPDDVSLPNETDDSNKRYDDELLVEEEEDPMEAVAGEETEEG